MTEDNENKETDFLLCEIAKDNDGWSCLTYTKNKWEEIAKVDEVHIKGLDVRLPLMAGKVMFDNKNCEIIELDHKKVLLCKKS